MAGSARARTSTAFGVLVLTVGLSVLSVGMAARADSPRIEATFVATGERPDLTLPLLPPAALDRSLPVSIAIPDIGVDSALAEVGLAADGTIEVPAPGPTYDLAAWYRYSPTPGERGPAIIEGHLDRPDGSPSVFYRLFELGSGATVEVLRADGRILRYVVTEVARYAKDAFPTDAVYGNLDHAGLRLLTCGGGLDEAGDYRDNVVVFATLVAVVERVASGSSERTADAASRA